MNIDLQRRIIYNALTLVQYNNFEDVLSQFTDEEKAALISRVESYITVFQ
ncbi:hypothetical protein [Bacillus sp. EB600]|nr:hypothetical protein [Bacillus sp. EB600]MCQ6281602.1 hypothetical protein [Bacillus sp. EB600]